VIVPRRRAPDPLLLRTHPPTEERVRRLLQLVPPTEHEPLGDRSPLHPGAYPAAPEPARLRFPGVRW
jgi:heat shock protein HtpX